MQLFSLHSKISFSLSPDSPGHAIGYYSISDGMSLRRTFLEVQTRLYNLSSCPTTIELSDIRICHQDWLRYSAAFGHNLVDNASPSLLCNHPSLTHGIREPKEASNLLISWLSAYVYRGCSYWYRDERQIPVDFLDLTRVAYTVGLPLGKLLHESLINSCDTWHNRFPWTDMLDVVGG